MNELASSPEHEYFHAIEDLFILRRGAPLLLSPRDYEYARKWHDDQIPLPIVLAALRELFDEKEDPHQVRSLGFCDRRVRRRWKELGALIASEVRIPEAPAASTAERLGAVAAALPEDLPDREAWAEEVRALPSEGTLAALEEALVAVESRLLGALEDQLPARSREAIERRAEEALAKLGRELSETARAEARSRLIAQEVRRRFGLTRLSLVG